MNMSVVWLRAVQTWFVTEQFPRRMTSSPSTEDLGNYFLPFTIEVLPGDRALVVLVQAIHPPRNSHHNMFTSNFCPMDKQMFSSSPCQ